MCLRNSKIVSCNEVSAYKQKSVRVVRTVPLYRPIKSYQVYET